MLKIPSFNRTEMTLILGALLTLSSFSTADDSVSFNQLQREILGPKCGICHITQMDTLENSVQYLSKAKATDGRDSKIIIPGDAKNSYLFMKVSNDSRIIGSKMPLNQPSLSNAEISLIKSWINEGASFNGIGKKL